MYILAIQQSVYISGILLLGATLVTGIYNFFSWLQYREKIILNYCFYLFSISAYIFFFVTASSYEDDIYHISRYARESANVLTIMTYTYFVYEAVNEWHEKYRIFFSLLRATLIGTIGYCSFIIFAGLIGMRTLLITDYLPMAIRLVYFIFALFSVKLFFARLKGPFLNLVKWGAVSYLSFIVIVMIGFFTKDSRVLGLDQMQWTFIGTFIEITIFSIAMSYKVKSLLARTHEVRDRISKDLHDEVGATLSGVTLMSELASQRLRSQKIEESQSLIERITQESKEMSEKMNDIVWAINPANDSMEKVLNKIHSYGKNICSSRNIHFHFVRPAETEASHLNMQIRNAIYLIGKEAINNAVKYSEAVNIRFTLSGKKDHFFMKIEDDGKGFDMHSGTTGNGLINMKARAAQMGGELQLYSAVGKGTRLELNF